MSVGAVVLAAGAGVRLGGVAKALLRVGAQTFLERIVASARAAGVVEVVVVIGRPHGDAVAVAARALGVTVVENPAPARGMASSVALGFGALAAAPVDAAFLWPVDHPAVQVSTLCALAAAIGAHQVAQPRFAGRGGHPPLIARSLWSALAACAADPDGARGVLRAADVLQVPVEDLGVVRDVDTAADLQEVG